MEYVVVDCYNTLASVYSIWYFEAVRRLFLEDVKKIFGIKTMEYSNTVCPQPLKSDETDVYFSQLESQWDKPS